MCLVNAIINTKLLRLQEVPGVLTCCHRSSGVLEGGLDPRSSGVTFAPIC